MAILYRTAKFKSFAIVILSSTAKFNVRQYFGYAVLLYDPSCQTSTCIGTDMILKILLSVVSVAACPINSLCVRLCKDVVCIITIVLWLNDMQE